MHIGFLVAGVSDLHELDLLPQLLQVESTRVAHAALNSARKPLNHVLQWTSEWDIALNALRTECLRIQRFSS